MKGLGVLCFEEDKDWFVGHFIALPTKQSYSILATSSFFLKNFYHYFHSIFNQTNWIFFFFFFFFCYVEEELEEESYPECCFPQGPPQFFSLTLKSSENIVYQFPKVLHSNNDLVSLSSEYFNFSSSQIKVDEEAEAVRTKYFRNFTYKEPILVCMGDMQILFDDRFLEENQKKLQKKTQKQSSVEHVPDHECSNSCQKEEKEKGKEENQGLEQKNKKRKLNEEEEEEVKDEWEIRIKN